MAEDEDDSQKTEEPTQRRLEEALKKGQVVHSKEITNFLMILALVMIISFLSPIISKNATLNLSFYIENADNIELNEKNIGGLLLKVMFDGISFIILPLLITMVAALASSIIQNKGFISSVEPIIPKLEKISIFKGFGRLFSTRSVIELVKGVIKLVIVAIVCYLEVRSDLPKLKHLHELSLAAILLYLLDLVTNMIIGVCIVLAIIAALDYLYQRYEFYKQMRMSKQDIKDEYKETEGSPEIKAKQRRIRAERARRRMMSAVPTADVVITNPTHYAVALKYEPKKMSAPVVVAKGQDNIALVMRKIAEQNDVPIVENPPLARTLYVVTDIDEEIPVEHYKAVAEIISYVYKLKGKKHVSS